MFNQLGEFPLISSHFMYICVNFWFLIPSFNLKILFRSSSKKLLFLFSPFILQLIFFLIYWYWVTSLCVCFISIHIVFCVYWKRLIFHDDFQFKWKRRKNENHKNHNKMKKVSHIFIIFHLHSRILFIRWELFVEFKIVYLMICRICMWLSCVVMWIWTQMRSHMRWCMEVTHRMRRI